VPRDDAVAVIKITGQGIPKRERSLMGRTQARLIETGGGIPEYIDDSVQGLMTDLGELAVSQLQASAPSRTGRLREGIVVTGRSRARMRPNIRVGVVAISDQGFNYTNVTRFGRRAVEAKSGFGTARPARQYRAVPGARGTQRRPFRAAMLKFEPGPPGTAFIYRKRVRAFKPRGDWVEKPAQRILKAGDAEWERITGDIQDAIERRGSSVIPKARRMSVHVLRSGGARRIR
jgi:hypothetical protein